MKIVIPVSIIFTMITANNIAIAETAWSSGTGYVADDVVYHIPVGDTLIHRFSALQASGGTSDPQTPVGGTADLYWLDEGLINMHKAFDIRNLDGSINGAISNKSSNASTIEIELTPGTTFDTIGFFGVEGGSVQVDVIDNAETTVFTQTEQVLANQFVYDYPTYITQGSEWQMRSEIVFDDLPGLVTDNIIDITITNTGDTAKVGQIVLGTTIEIGQVSGPGSSVGQEDYSLKNRNQFGNLNYIEGNYTKLNTYDVKVNTDEITRLTLLFAHLRGKPAIYMIDADTDQLGTTTFGVFNDWSVDHEAAGVSHLTIEIEGFV